jgi:hypothetical protein
VQQVLDIAERKGKATVHHDRQVDDLRAAVKALERACFRHAQRPRNHPARPKQICSDNAHVNSPTEWRNGRPKVPDCALSVK